MGLLLVLLAAGGAAAYAIAKKKKADAAQGDAPEETGGSTFNFPRQPAASTGGRRQDPLASTPVWQRPRRSSYGSARRWRL